MLQWRERLVHAASQGAAGIASLRQHLASLTQAEVASSAADSLDAALSVEGKGQILLTICQVEAVQTGHQSAARSSAYNSAAAWSCFQWPNSIALLSLACIGL